MSFPKADERKKCWSARDEFWKCLERNKEDRSGCSTERSAFENSCVKQWVKYFDRRRDYLKYKEKIENEGYEPVDEPKSKTNL